MSGYSVENSLRKFSKKEFNDDEDQFDPDVIELHEEAVDLEELVWETVRHFSREARLKGLTLDVSIAASTPKAILADPLRLRQILLIGLGNSIRSTHKGGIGLNLRAERDSRGDWNIEVAITDNGAGADATAKHGIFARLVRAMQGNLECLVDHELGSTQRFIGRFESV